jgi:DNA (cytosine-5)-methyltransferase 1
MVEAPMRLADSNPSYRLLDLFCGAGGAAMGYHRAGFEVIGIDLKPQPRYPFPFFQADALRLPFGGFDAIHASPPCQAHSSIGAHARRLTGVEHPDLVPATRDLLVASGLPYVIENVPGAPLIAPVVICGSSVGLNVRRHRLFETNWPLMVPPCAHGWQTPRFQSSDSRRRHLVSTVVGVYGGHRATVVGVHGNCNYAGEQALREWAMEVDWMNSYELTQAIPPAYTELIGHQLMQHLKVSVCA